MQDPDWQDPGMQDRVAEGPAVALGFTETDRFTSPFRGLAGIARTGRAAASRQWNGSWWKKV